MTSTKTFYFTTVLRSMFTETKAQGIGDRPAFNDIGSFEDFWDVRDISAILFYTNTNFLGYKWTYS
jgi:hypothetical protein